LVGGALYRLPAVVSGGAWSYLDHSAQQQGNSSRARSSVVASCYKGKTPSDKGSWLVFLPSFKTCGVAKLFQFPSPSLLDI